MRIPQRQWGVSTDTSLARDIRIVEVRGSSPLCSTNKTATLHGWLLCLFRSMGVCPLTEDNATHWRGAGIDDRQWRKSRQFRPQRTGSELPSGESRPCSLRARGSTPLCSTKNQDHIHGDPDFFMQARSVRIPCPVIALNALERGVAEAPPMADEARRKPGQQRRLSNSREDSRLLRT